MSAERVERVSAHAADRGGGLSASVRGLLLGRLEAVAGAVEALRARKRPGAEQVHALRVSTRKAEAALLALAASLPEDERRWVRRRLRGLRRAAAEARDWHISRPWLRRGAAGEDASLAKQAERAERTAARALHEEARRFALGRFRRRARAMLGVSAADAAGNGQPPLEEARGAVRASLARVRRAARGEARDEATLHTLRVRLKRLRYTIELFGGESGAGLVPDEAVRELRELIDQLGAMTDAAAVRDRLPKRSTARAKATIAARRALARARRAWARASAGGLLDRLDPGLTARRGAQVASRGVAG
jgi:CHAD domain-containing protein